MGDLGWWRRDVDAYTQLRYGGRAYASTGASGRRIVMLRGNKLVVHDSCGGETELGKRG